MACRGVVRYRVELCTFFLPLLITHALQLEQQQPKTEESATLAEEIVEEVSLVLMGTDPAFAEEGLPAAVLPAPAPAPAPAEVLTQPPHQQQLVGNAPLHCCPVAVHSVFKLLDTLQLFVATARTECRHLRDVIARHERKMAIVAEATAGG
jgi:hypothetical protein